jgi:hypothetical protein
MPDSPERRLFLSLYFPPLDPFPGAAFAVKVNEMPLESVRPSRSGDYYFEWGLPCMGAESRAVVTLEFDSVHGCLPWVRSMGIVGLDSPSSLDSLLRRKLEERITWSRELEAQLAHSQELLEKYNRQLRGKETSPFARTHPPART